MKPSPDPDTGYIRVNLRDNGRRKNALVHRLVLEAFVGPSPTEEHESRHLDGNASNNRLSNLRWGTSAENEADKKRHGTSPVGENHPHAKLTDQQVKEIRDMYKSGNYTQAEIASQYPVQRPQICRIINKKRRN